MTKSKKSVAKKRTLRKDRTATRADIARIETRTGESLTVLWTVTVLMVLITNLMTVGAHFYLVAHPAAEKMALLKGLVLFTGSLVGGVSLVVLPILYRIRRVPPPTGLAVFGVCVAAAPILAVFALAIQ